MIIWKPWLSECTACATYVPEFLNAAIYSLHPATVRKLVYAVLAQPEQGILSQCDARAEWEILVKAELCPPVNGNPSIPTRNSCEQNVLHFRGVCLKCKHEISFPDGELFPLKSCCKFCYGSEKMPKITARIPFCNSFTQWPGDYQMEFLTYILGDKN
jgi:hypothetical protein